MTSWLEPGGERCGPAPRKSCGELEFTHHCSAGCKVPLELCSSPLRSTMVITDCALSVPCTALVTVWRGMSAFWRALIRLYPPVGALPRSPIPHRFARAEREFIHKRESHGGNWPSRCTFLFRTGCFAPSEARYSKGQAPCFP